MWWVMYFFSVVSDGWNLSGLGALLLNLLFLGSTALTEKISSEKYPAYKEYQKEVSMLIPGIPNIAKSTKSN
jgi:steroid 5-alpha reductase family enzyme